MRIVHGRVFKRTAGAVATVFVFFAALPGLANEVVPSSGMPYQPQYQANNLAAQVVFDGEGEAQVAVEMTFNAEKEPVQSVRMSIPGTSVRILRAVQEYRQNVDEQVCVRWKPLQYPPIPMPRSTPLSDVEVEQMIEGRPCLQSTTQRSYVTKVKDLDVKLEATSDGYTLTLPLAHKVEPREGTVILLSYKASGYVRQGAFQAFFFDIPTPSVPFDLQRVRVAVDVQPGLILEGGKATTSYRPSIAEGLAEAVIDEDGVASGLLGSRPVTQYIETRSAGFTREQISLDPGESFHVTGRYATRWIRFHYGGLVTAAVLVVLFLLVIVWGERRMRRIAATSA